MCRVLVEAEAVIRFGRPPAQPHWGVLGTISQFSLLALLELHDGKLSKLYPKLALHRDNAPKESHSTLNAVFDRKQLRMTEAA